MNYNKVLLIGNLTRDPELRYLQSGTAVCNFGLATNRRYKKQDGEFAEDTCFVDITVWGRQAETSNEYLKKGSPAFIEGRLNFDSWEGNDGQKRNKLTVVAERVQFMPRSGGGGGGGAPSMGGPAEVTDHGQSYEQYQEPDAPAGSDPDVPF